MLICPRNITRTCVGEKKNFIETGDLSISARLALARARIRANRAEYRNGLKARTANAEHASGCSRDLTRPPTTRAPPVAELSRRVCQNHRVATRDGGTPRAQVECEEVKEEKLRESCRRARTWHGTTQPRLIDDYRRMHPHSGRATTATGVHSFYSR